ncbi:MAG: hypothetical protein IPN68_18580 [Bacteroidetes bacterium]|nr:hypothetical protein [Bacteroidota bacterium]
MSTVLQLATERTRLIEHFNEYDLLAKKIGIAFLKDIVLNEIASEERLRWAFERDPNLNNITLYLWDGVKGARERLKKKTACPTCGHVKTQHYVDEERAIYAEATLEMRRRSGVPMALADRVCVLKHVAKHYILGISLNEYVKNRLTGGGGES